jgi:N utilization substance protein B
MAARSKARKRALDILFESEARGISALDLLRERVAAGDPPINEYTITLVRGVVDHTARIDELISSYAQGWSLARMPAVDRNTLRIGIYEILWVTDVPDAVAVSEALHLVRDLSTDESPTFVNGVLGNIVRDKAALSA